MNTSYKLGRQGEARGAVFLKQKNYRIVEKITATEKQRLILLRLNIIY